MADFAFHVAYPSGRADLKTGSLKTLPIAGGSERSGDLYLVFRDADVASPAVQHLAKTLRDASVGLRLRSARAEFPQHDRRSPLTSSASGKLPKEGASLPNTLNAFLSLQPDASGIRKARPD